MQVGILASLGMHWIRRIYPTPVKAGMKNLIIHYLGTVHTYRMCLCRTTQHHDCKAFVRYGSYAAPVLRILLKAFDVSATLPFIRDFDAVTSISWMVEDLFIFISISDLDRKEVHETK